jgi:hypothetical protein
LVGFDLIRGCSESDIPVAHMYCSTWEALRLDSGRSERSRPNNGRAPPALAQAATNGAASSGRSNHFVSKAHFPKKHIAEAAVTVTVAPLPSGSRRNNTEAAALCDK